MTPEQEKANELFDKFDLPTGLMSIERKQCALIVIDELIEREKMWLEETGKEQSDNWFIKVKQEIENL